MISRQNLQSTIYNLQLCILLLCMGCITSLSAGGPWTQQKSKGYAQASFTFIPVFSSLYSNGSEETLFLPYDVTDRTFLGYAEFGLTGNLTAIFEMPVKMIETKFLPNVDANGITEGSATRFGNFGFALKQNLIRSTVVVSGQLKVETPISASDEDLLAGLRSGFDAWGVSPTLSVGGSKKNLYAYIESGIRLRNRGYSNEWLLAGEAGALLARRLWVIAVLDIRQAYNTGSFQEVNILSGLYPDNQEHAAYGFKLIADITDQVGLNFARFGAFSGNLVPKAASNTVGLFVKF